MKDPRRVPRYSVEPLERLVGGAELLALAVGTTTRNVYRRRHNGLSEREADEWACRCGINPRLVWPEWGRHTAMDVRNAGKNLPATFGG